MEERRGEKKDRRQDKRQKQKRVEDKTRQENSHAPERIRAGKRTGRTSWDFLILRISKHGGKQLAGEMHRAQST